MLGEELGNLKVVVVVVVVVKGGRLIMDEGVKGT